MGLIVSYTKYSEYSPTRRDKRAPYTDLNITHCTAKMLPNTTSMPTNATPVIDCPSSPQPNSTVLAPLKAADLAALDARLALLLATLESPTG